MGLLDTLKNRNIDLKSAQLKVFEKDRYDKVVGLMNKYSMTRPEAIAYLDNEHRLEAAGVRTEKLKDILGDIKENMEQKNKDYNNND